MNNSLIIPIEPPVQDDAIAILVRRRNEYSLPQLAAMDSIELRAIQREHYWAALRSGVLTVINLAASQMGSFEAGRANWTFTGGTRTISITWDQKAGITEATVNGAMVLSNAVAGEERLIPGNWLYDVYDALRRHKAEAEAEEARKTAQEKEELILNLVADV